MVSKNDAAGNAQAIVLERGDHCVSRKDISTNALKVLNRLHRSQFRKLSGGRRCARYFARFTPKRF